MSTSGSMDDLSAIVTRLSKELEMMGLPGLASASYHHHQCQQQVESSNYGATMVVAAQQPAVSEDVISDLISSNYELIGLLRDLQRSKRQREDHAQQLIHDLQRSQWLLDKEKELGVQREREAAEAYEKERQANVRLQLSETLLKKKSEENRQLAHESQLKENQWLHALRRRDQENHRLHQQLLKFLHSKSTAGSGATGIVQHQVEMRGSLMGAPARASLSDSTSSRSRKQWDRTAAADDAKKLVEAKWKMALNSLEKDHGLLRADYFQLVEMVGRFLTNCSTKLTTADGRHRSADDITRPFSNVTEWIQLPVVAMRDRLEQVFRLVEAGLVISTTFPITQSAAATNHQMEIITDRQQQQQQQSFDCFEIDYVMPAAAIAATIGQPLLLEPVITADATSSAAHQQLLAVENQKVAATRNCISPPPIIVQDKVVVAGVTSRTSSNAISTATATKSAAAALKMAKSIVQQQQQQQHSTTGHITFDGISDPYYADCGRIAFRNPPAGRNDEDDESSHVVNQVDWNDDYETDSSPPTSAAIKIGNNNNNSHHQQSESYSLLMGRHEHRQPASSASTMSGTITTSYCPVIGLLSDDDDDRLLLPMDDDEMLAITLDTPCPSASNSSRSGSCSSTCSISSCKSQQQQESGIDPPAAAGHAGASSRRIDEHHHFLRTSSSDDDEAVAASQSADGPSSARKSAADGRTTLHLNRRTITAKVRFVQQQPSGSDDDDDDDDVALLATAGRHLPGDPVDLECCLISSTPPHPQ